jgi:hypothetical protein
MNEIIPIYLKWTFIVSAISYGSIFLLFIAPAIKTKQKFCWSDWLGLNNNRFSHLDEYKQVCLERGDSLFFYRICRGILKFLVFSITVCFLLAVI